MPFFKTLWQNPLDILWLALAVINLAAFIVMGVDKRRAVKKRWRVPESTLFLLAAAGGSVGGILGMLIFRHKTRHLKFVFGFPAILLAEAAAVFFLCSRIG